MLYDRHSRAAYSLAYRMMNGRQAAEDLVQDAFLKVWRAATSYRADRGGVRTWILSIVHNQGIDQLRSHASRRRTQDKVEGTPSPRFGSGPGASSVVALTKRISAPANQAKRRHLLEGSLPSGNSRGR